MMKSTTMLAAMAALAALALSGCYREQRPTRTPAAAAAVGEPSYAAKGVPVDNKYEENAYAVSQGQTWFRAFNCSGCHGGGGGGGMGPPLMDAKWRYGSDPASIYASIAYGRPNGMPAFGSHLTQDQIWQLAAFVRLLSGQLSKNVASSRSDTLQDGKGESRRPKETPVHEQTPAADR